MRKLILFAILLFSAGAMTAQQLDFGAKAGVNFASLSGDDLEGLDGKTGFHLGLVAEFGFSERFSIQPEVLYSALGASASEGDGKINLDYISVPVMAKFYVIDGLSLEAGPQFSFNVVAEAEENGETVDLDDLFEEETKTTDVGGGVGLGYELPMGLFFQGRYVFGLTEIWKDSEVNNNVFQLSLGYKF